MTAEDIAKAIRLLEWTIATKIPADLKNTNHARRIASLKRQQAEAEAELARLVTELGSKVQEEGR